MESNQIIKDIYAAVVAKQKKHCIESGSSQTAVAVGNDVIEVGKTWTESFANDGKIDDAEEAKMNETFAAKVDKWIPNVTGVVVTVAWDGFTLFGLGWKGLRYYLNKFWSLGL